MSGISDSEEKTFQTFISEAKSSFDIKQLQRIFIARDYNLKKSLILHQQMVEDQRLFQHLTDKTGHPTVMCIQRNLDATHYNEPLEYQFLIWTFLKAFDSADQNGTGSINVVLDRYNLTKKNMALGVIRVTIRVIKYLQDFHPERLNKVIITHPDFIFSFAYGMVKPFLNERTKSKIVLIPDFKGLKNFYYDWQILPEQGGTSQFVFSENMPDFYTGDPSLDEHPLQQNTIQVKNYDFNKLKKQSKFL